MKLSKILFAGLIVLMLGSHVASGAVLSEVFTSQRDDIALFIDNVLRQFPSRQVLECADAVKKELGEVDDAKFYEALVAKLKPLRGYLDTMRVMKLLRFQKNVLKGQIKDLLGETKVITNCLEIGTPGTYASTIRKHIQGEVIALLEKSALTDVLQAHSLNPVKKFKGYDRLVPLNGYEPISDAVADGSIDVAICTIGLHHIPPAKLEAFVDSIRRVMCPGGIFVLRDHDASTPELVDLASAAHSVFNAVIPQESVAAEVAEVRNFHPISYWKELLGKSGFEVGDQGLLQEGDSTRNTFIRAIRAPATEAERIEAIAFTAQQHAGYGRDGAQTYLTTPEWNNVDAAQQYGQFINTVPFYEFPYWAHIKTFWKTFAASWRCAAQEKGGHAKVLFSPNLFFNYVMMNLFIGTSMTVEYGAKALVSLPIRLLIGGAEATTLLALVNDPEGVLATLDPSISVKEVYDNGVKLVAVPRYVQFLKIVRKMQQSSAAFIKIAGNDHIACKIRYAQKPTLHEAWVEKFTWVMPTQPDLTYAVVSVPVKDLKGFVAAVEADGAELLYVHDF